MIGSKTINDGLEQPGEKPSTASFKNPQIGQGPKLPDVNSIRDESLVQNQMTNLLQDDSDYMKLAASQGRQQANAAGIQDTTMGIEAVRTAQIGAALPIAQQDASLYGQSDLQNSAYHQNANLAGQAFGHNTQLADQQFGYNTQLADQSYGHNQGLANQAFGHNTQLNQQQHQNTLSQNLANMNNNANLNMDAHMQSMQQSLQQAINQVNSDITLTPAQRQDIINNMINDFNNQAQYAQSNNQYNQNFNESANNLSQNFQFQGPDMNNVTMQYTKPATPAPVAPEDRPMVTFNPNNSR